MPLPLVLLLLNDPPIVRLLPPPPPVLWPVELDHPVTGELTLPVGATDAPFSRKKLPETVENPVSALLLRASPRRRRGTSRRRATARH